MDISAFVAAANMTEAELARLAGTTPATINRLRHGKNGASVDLALTLERVSEGKIDAAILSRDVALVRSQAAA